MVARFLLALLLALAFRAAAETIRFPSATWPPTILQQERMPPMQTIAETASVPITGELYRPAGNGPFPAVVLLPPCGNLAREVQEAEAARYRALGYALFVVDSYGPRGIADGCTGTQAGGSVDLVMDAYGALLHLATLSSIDAERIAIVGYSRGATAVLASVLYDGPERLFDRGFRAAVAYSPACEGAVADLGVPTLIFSAGLDEMNPPRWCRTIMQRRRKLGPEPRLVVYGGANHGFQIDDVPRNFYGYRLTYDEAAARAAWAEVTALLRSAFGR
jgi:dienelactone hydrolase